MKDFLQRGVQLAHFGFRKRIGASARPDVGTKQRLIGIDVSYAVQELLVQQRRFHRRFAGVKKPGKFFCVDLSGSAPGPLKLVCRASRRPKRRGSTKRSSLPDASLATR